MKSPIEGFVWLLCGAALAALLLCTAMLQKTLNWDAERNIVAAMQYEQGRSPNIMTLVTADPNDLTRDRFVSDVARAPGYQAVPYLLRRAGLSWDSALRVVVFVMLLAGGVGWTLCCRRIVPGGIAQPCLVLLLLLAPCNVTNTMEYSGGNLMVWATVPYLVLVNGLATRGGRIGWLLALLGGFGCVAVFLLKYSGVFVGIGLGLVWLWDSIRRAPRRRLFPFWVLGALLGVAAVLISHLPLAHTPVSQPSGCEKNPRVLVIGAWVTAMTDLASVLERAAKGMGLMGWDVESFFVPIAGVALGVLLAALAWNERDLLRDLASRLGHAADSGRLSPAWFLVPAATDTLLYTGMILLHSIGVTSRIARMTGMLMAPLVFVFLLQCAALGKRASRVLAMALIAALFVVPPTLGVSRLAREAIRLGQNRFTNPSGIENPSLGSTVDQARFVEELKAGLGSEERVLYVIDPKMILPIPRQRFVLVYVIDNHYTSGQLEQMRFRGRPNAGVAILVPLPFVYDGRLKAIKKSFVDFQDWEQFPLPSAPQWQLWRSVPANRGT